MGLWQSAVSGSDTDVPLECCRCRAPLPVGKTYGRCPSCRLVLEFAHEAKVLKRPRIWRIGCMVLLILLVGYQTASKGGWLTPAGLSITLVAWTLVWGLLFETFAWYASGSLKRSRSLILPMAGWTAPPFLAAQLLILLAGMIW